MAKRKKMRLGSAYPVHIKNAREATENVRTNVFHVRRTLAKGDCRAALDFLSTATEALGSARSEKIGAQLRGTTPAGRAVYNAMKAFRSKCMKRRPD